MLQPWINNKKCNYSEMFFFNLFPLVGLSRIVAVVRLVVHDQLSVDEVEGVGSGVERMRNHLTDQLGVQLWEIVDLRFEIETEMFYIFDSSSM